MTAKTRLLALFCAVAMASGGPQPTTTTTTTTVETDSGWKGCFTDVGLKAQQRRHSSGDTVASMESSSPSPYNMESLLGGEPPLLPVAVEHQGVNDIIAGLTEVEKDQMLAFDMTMPIRHFRAEKVRCRR